MSAYHTPVLLNESIEALGIKPQGVYVDATFGGGGHSRAILERLGPKGRLLGFDQDKDVEANLPQDPRFTWVYGNFRFVSGFCRYYGAPQVDGILADLGVSSHQFDTGARGFSFRFEGALDMRMNTQSPLTAAHVVNTYSPEALETLLRTYSELPNARAVAKALVQAREAAPLETHRALCAALQSFTPAATAHKFLAKVYQGLRIEVNAEMRALEDFLHQTLPLLKPGGTLAIITYHSLEDRLVKQFLKQAKEQKTMEWLTKKPLLPGEEEIAQNTRARSAKLRAARKTQEETPHA